MKKIQTLSFLATLAIALGMISWGSALHAQDTAPSTAPDRQAQQPSSQSPDTATPPQSPDSSQAPDSTSPRSRMPQSGAQNSSPSDSSATGAGESQTFSGTITKQGDKYVLKDDSGHVYDIDHQDEVKKFDGKRVRVQGTLDPATNKIMVK